MQQVTCLSSECEESHFATATHLPLQAFQRTRCFHSFAKLKNQSPSVLLILQVATGWTSVVNTTLRTQPATLIVMDDSAARVFAIPELLEQILLCVYENENQVNFMQWMSTASISEVFHEDFRRRATQGRRRLFTIQRVNKTFRDVILGSIELHRYMGLQAHAG